MQRAQKILETTFGYPRFRLNQADIVGSLLKGEDVLALMPTGGGKSLCYQVPALVLEGVCVVISPLVALMQDQVDALNQLGIKAAFLNSSLSVPQARQTEQALLRGELKLLYVAPERLVTERCLSLLAQVKVNLFAIDEAHCVSQWGHDFRPEYQRLSILAEQFPHSPRIALTATADEATRKEIISHLRLENAARYINSFDRPNIRYAINESGSNRDALWRFIQQNHTNDAGIVYCLSRKKVEATAQWLTKQGRVALPYHAGMDSQQRLQNQQRFLRDSGVIIVATIAFGMGIDKPDVRFVAHLSLPKSMEAYYQETGRAGRDGLPASAWMAYGLQDVITLRQMMQQSEASEQYKQISQQKLEAMLGLCELISCRRQTLLSYFGEDLKEPCGNCDNCLSPPQTFDATEAAQKALSCVYRSGQQFGVVYLIDILLGKDSEKIQKNQHHRLSTFAIGQDLSIAEWRSLFRQLIAQGLLFVDSERFGAIRLTEKSRSLLKGEVKLLARKQTRPAATAKSGRKSNSPLASIHQPLMQALKQLRKSLADEQGLPPYVVFHDATLMQMAEQRPQSLQQMQFISGVGERKLAQYGRAFLDVVTAHPLPNTVSSEYSDEVNQMLIGLAQGEDLDAIAQQQKVAMDVIYQQLASVAASNELDLLQLLPISTDDFQLIQQALTTCNDEPGGRVRAACKLLDEQFSKALIQCVAAANVP